MGVADELTCAPKPPGAVGLGAAGATSRGFGSPSSVTSAVNVTGVPGVTLASGAILIDGGMFGSSRPGSKLPLVMITRSVISCGGISFP